MGAWRDHIEAQRGTAAALVERGGRLCVRRFGDLESEYHALSDGAALVDRSDRGLLEITGADRAPWLHNLTTNEVKNVSPGEGNYAFVVNVQGRIQFDINVLVLKDKLWVDLDRGWLELAIAHFDKYTIVEDVSVTDRTDEFVRLGLVGEGARSVTEALGAPHAPAMPQLGTATIEWGGCSISLVRHDFCGPFGVELFVPVDRAVALWEALVDPSTEPAATPAGEEAVDIHRIEAGLPWPLREITNEYLPAETGQLERAVSYTKGCYLGQEVVERMRTREALARRLVGLRIEGEAIPPSGATIGIPEGTSAGVVTSACRSVLTGSVIALGYLKTAHCDPGTVVEVKWADGQARAVVKDLPFTEKP